MERKEKLIRSGQFVVWKWQGDERVYMKQIRYRQSNSDEYGELKEAVQLSKKDAFSQALAGDAGVAELVSRQNGGYVEATDEE